MVVGLRAVEEHDDPLTRLHLAIRLTQLRPLLQRDPGRLSRIRAIQEEPDRPRLWVLGRPDLLLDGLQVHPRAVLIHVLQGLRETNLPLLRLIRQDRVRGSDTGVIENLRLTASEPILLVAPRLEDRLGGRLLARHPRVAGTHETATHLRSVLLDSLQHGRPTLCG